MSRPLPLCPQKRQKSGHSEIDAQGQEKTIARFVADQYRRLEMERFIADGGFLLESIVPYP
jgi:hypothetical protein